MMKILTIAGLSVLGVITLDLFSPAIAVADESLASYQVVFEGDENSTFNGSYEYAKSAGIGGFRTRQVVKNQFPATYTFEGSAREDVSARGISYPNQRLEVRFYKNGVECGKPMLMGEAGKSNKICRSK